MIKQEIGGMQLENHFPEIQVDQSKGANAQVYSVVRAMNNETHLYCSRLCLFVPFN